MQQEREKRATEGGKRAIPTSSRRKKKRKEGEGRAQETVRKWRRTEEPNFKRIKGKEEGMGGAKVVSALSKRQQKKEGGNMGAKIEFDNLWLGKKGVRLLRLNESEGMFFPFPCVHTNHPSSLPAPRPPVCREEGSIGGREKDSDIIYARRSRKRTNEEEGRGKGNRGRDRACKNLLRYVLHSGALVSFLTEIVS